MWNESYSYNITSGNLWYDEYNQTYSVKMDYNRSNLTQSVFKSYSNQPIEEQLTDIVSFLHLVFTPCLAFGSFMGNMLCIPIFMRKKLWSLSTSHYIVAILCAELLHMVVLLHTWLNDYKMLMDSYTLSGWCQLMTMLQNASDFLCNVYTLAFVMDRFIACWYARYECRWCTPFKAKLVIIAAAILSLIIYINTSLIHGEYKVGIKLYCTPLLKYYYIHQKLQNVGIFMNFILAFGSITVLTGLTVIKFVRQRKERRRLPVRVTARSVSAMLKPSVEDQNEAENQLIMFVSFMVMFLLCNLPFQGSTLYFSVHNMVFRNTMSQDTELRQILLSRVLLYVKYSRILMNFPLFMTGYNLFRHELKDIVTCLVKRNSCSLRRDSSRDMTISDISQDYLAPIRLDCVSES